MEFSESRRNVVREELQRLLGSTAFRTSKRCKEFLEYIVEHTLNGPSATLKERSIGAELFRLPPDFDTSQHTIVRVTANEVRKKLAQHYMAENGIERPVRIELPPGSYSADFRWHAAADVFAGDPSAESTRVPAPTMEEPAPVAPVVEAPAVPTGGAVRPARWRSAAAIACAVTLLVVGVLSWRSLKSSQSASGDARATSVARFTPASFPAEQTLRMIAGSTTPYLDRSGRTWGPDRFFSGGSTVVRPAERIFRTLDPDIYRHARYGDFQYDIPLEARAYELHLHFAETGLADFISAESSGEGQRLFRVFANGKMILDQFDVIGDAAGANISDERVFRDISPAADGKLHLSFTSMRSTATVSAIELIPMESGRVKPLRIRAGWPASWVDPSGEQWHADSYFLGGNALVRTTNPAHGSESPPPDTALYASERWGHFSYALPVADGRYRVILKFCEGHYGRRNTGVGGLGSRVFDVYANGVALLRNFDIFKEAGGEGRPIDKSFSGLRPTAQGKIVLTFVPVAGMACVNGIEVSAED